MFCSTCLKEDILPKYTNIRLHDRAARNERFTLKYRRCLVQRELENAKKKIEVLEKEVASEKALLANKLDEETLQPIIGVIRENVENLDIECKIKISRKLNRLYDQDLCLPDTTGNCYVNLSNYILSKSEEELLNLGLNCHIQSPVDKYKKKVELEILYEQILNLQSSKVVDVNTE